MKKDCTNMLTFLKEKERMCKNIAKCINCELSEENNESGTDCQNFIIECPKEAIDIVQRWSDEHPEKTYADDFLEKFPNASMKQIGCDKYPTVCLSYVYGEESEPENCNFCFQCWNRSMK